MCQTSLKTTQNYSGEAVFFFFFFPLTKKLGILSICHPLITLTSSNQSYANRQVHCFVIPKSQGKSRCEKWKGNWVAGLFSCCIMQAVKETSQDGGGNSTVLFYAVDFCDFPDLKILYEPTVLWTTCIYQKARWRETTAVHLKYREIISSPSALHFHSLTSAAAHN